MPNQPARLSFSAARRQLAAIGITLSHHDGEYRVAYSGRDQESTAYYTNDVADAVGTARAMLAHKEAA